LLNEEAHETLKNLCVACEKSENDKNQESETCCGNVRAYCWKLLLEISRADYILFLDPGDNYTGVHFTKFIGLYLSFEHFSLGVFI
jgi:hypothetical protein